jgi:hypothetical protein
LLFPHSSDSLLSCLLHLLLPALGGVLGNTWCMYIYVSVLSKLSRGIFLTWFSLVQF